MAFRNGIYLVCLFLLYLRVDPCNEIVLCIYIIQWYSLYLFVHVLCWRVCHKTLHGVFISYLLHVFHALMFCMYLTHLMRNFKCATE